MTRQLAVFPGTFDPITLGHMDIVRRASAIFSEVVVAVAHSPSKHTLIPHQRRVALADQACRELGNVSCQGFEGLMIDFLRQLQARILVRGIRTMADCDYELQLTGMYRALMPELEIVLLPTASEMAYISSALVREVMIHHGDITRFVPAAVAAALGGSGGKLPEGGSP